MTYFQQIESKCQNPPGRIFLKLFSKQSCPWKPKSVLQTAGLVCQHLQKVFFSNFQLWSFEIEWWDISLWSWRWQQKRTGEKQNCRKGKVVCLKNTLIISSPEIFTFQIESKSKFLPGRAARCADWKKQPQTKSSALGGAGHAVVFGDYLWWRSVILVICLTSEELFLQFMVHLLTYWLNCHHLWDAV